MRLGARHRAWDLLAYVAIALAVLATIAMLAVHDADTGRSRELPLKWIGFAGLTAITFGYAVRHGFQMKVGNQFWAAMAAYFVVRTGIWVLLLTRVEVVPLLLYALMAGPECVLLLTVLNAFMRDDR